MLDLIVRMAAIILAALYIVIVLGVLTAIVVILIGEMSS